MYPTAGTFAVNMATHQFSKPKSIEKDPKVVSPVVYPYQNHNQQPLVPQNYNQQPQIPHFKQNDQQYYASYNH